MRHILEAQEFTPEFIDIIFKRAAEFQTAFEAKIFRQNFGKILSGRMMFTIFYEPSTRTRISFGAAGQHLGMSVVATENAKEFSSAAKGETLEDTIRVLCEYQPDIIVLRHDETDAAKRAAKVSSVPIINAGDGMGQHPTQALLDLYTIQKEKGHVDNTNVIIGGDLLHGRTGRSLTYLLSKFAGNHITFISPVDLKIGQDIKDYLDAKKFSYNETTELTEHLKEADVVYWTRIQKERFDSSNLQSVYTIGPKEMQLLKPDAVLLHPLPRVGEIDPTVDADPRAAYFRQAGNGMFIRMALMEWVLGYI